MNTLSLRNYCRVNLPKTLNSAFGRSPWHLWVWLLLLRDPLLHQHHGHIRRAPDHQWIGRCPPVDPPEDVLEIEEEERRLKDWTFKKSYPCNPIFDETGTINLPADSKGILILSPETRTRVTDVDVEQTTLIHYMNWLHQAWSQARHHVPLLHSKWIAGLKEEVEKEYNCICSEYREVVDEERKKHGLTEKSSKTGQRQSLDRGRRYGGDNNIRRDDNSQPASNATLPQPSRVNCKTTHLPKSL